jgi:hypothetical protein
MSQECFPGLRSGGDRAKIAFVLPILDEKSASHFLTLEQFTHSGEELLEIKRLVEGALCAQTYGNIQKVQPPPEIAMILTPGNSRRSAVMVSRPSSSGIRMLVITNSVGVFTPFQ